MQNIVIAKPYKFVPPHTGNFWPMLLRPFLPRYLKSFGIEQVECRGVERLAASINAGHGIMLAPNHCRPCDPFVVASLGHRVGRYVHIMASWHLFMQNRAQTFLLPRAGVFSIYREGLDREALKCAIQILAGARRPLVVFPEGVISRHNDRLNHLMEGTALMLRSAAKQRAQGGGKVVVHPVALRYFFDGDLDAACKPVLADIEKRLLWQVQDELPLVERVLKAGSALLSLKEIEFFGGPQTGDLAGRISRLVDRMLTPLENEWLKGRHEEDIVARVKLLRTAILPDMISGEVSADEMERCWRELEVIYLAQQIAFYPAGYFTPEPTIDRVLETVEKFEEDLTDNCRTHRPFRAIVDVGEAIEVAPDRPRGEADPVMVRMREQLEAMLAASFDPNRTI